MEQEETSMSVEENGTAPVADVLSSSFPEESNSQEIMEGQETFQKEISSLDQLVNETLESPADENTEIYEDCPMEGVEESVSVRPSVIAGGEPIESDETAVEMQDTQIYIIEEGDQIVSIDDSGLPTTLGVSDQTVDESGVPVQETNDEENAATSSETVIDEQAIAEKNSETHECVPEEGTGDLNDALTTETGDVQTTETGDVQTTGTTNDATVHDVGEGNEKEVEFSIPESVEDTSVAQAISGGDVLLQALEDANVIGSGEATDGDRTAQVDSLIAEENLENIDTPTAEPMEGILGTEEVTEVEENGPIDQGKFKKKAALGLSGNKSGDDSVEEITVEEGKVKQEATEFLEGGITRTGRVVKRKKFTDEVEGLELDGDIAAIDVIPVKKPRTKFSPYRPVTLLARKPIQAPPIVTTPLLKPSKTYGKFVAISSNSRFGQLSVKPFAKTLPEPIIRTVHQKIDSYAESRSLAHYDSETDDDDDAPVVKRYKRTVPDSYLLAKNFIRPSYVCLHDVAEYGLWRRITQISGRLATCKICTKGYKKKPSALDLRQRWFPTSCPTSTYGPTRTRGRPAVTPEEPEPVPTPTKTTQIHVNPCGTTPGTIMMKVTLRGTTSSFVMNQSAYMTLAKNLNKGSNVGWPIVPVYPKTPKNLTFPAEINLTDYMPPVAPLTASQKNNILNSIAPGAKVGKPKSLLELVKSINNDVTIVPPGAKKPLSTSNAGGDSKNMKTCKNCSQVYRGTVHKCPKEDMSPNRKKQNMDPKKAPSKRLKLCPDCNLVYAENETHSCKKVKKTKPKGSQKKTTPTSYQLCPHCIKIYKETEPHTCAKKLAAEKEVSKPAAPPTPKPKPTPPPKPIGVPNQVRRKPPAARKRENEEKANSLRESVPPKEPEPEIKVDETPYAMMCPQCSSIYMSNEKHVCGESASKIVEEAYSILCAMCSNLYKANETHSCPLSTIPVSPIKEESPSKLDTTIDSGIMNEVFSLPNLDGKIEEKKFTPDTKTKSTVKECEACLKFYKETMFPTHPCVPVKRSGKKFCKTCVSVYPANTKHKCPKAPSPAKSTPQKVANLLKHDRVATTKCENCKKELTSSQMAAHDCPNKSRQLSYKCSKCPFTTVNKDQFSQHSCVKNVQVFKCEGCPKMFSKMEFLEKHVANMCPSRQVSCENGCGQQIKFTEVQKHKCPMLAFKCRHCSATFSSWNELDAHDNMYHYQ